MRKVFHPVARAEDVPPGTGIPIKVGDDPNCALFRTSDGEFFASTSLCPHQNEALDQGRLEGCEVICRRHHLRFDLRTGDCTNAGGYWLRMMEVRRTGDHIEVGIWEYDDDPRSA